MLTPPSINSFSLGTFKIYFYGIIIAFAIFISISVLKFLCKKSLKNLNFEIIIDILPLTIIVAILAARVYYVCLNFDYYSFHLREILMIWQGGLSLHGAILGGSIALLAQLKLKKVEVLKYFDVLACVMPLGQAIGRWGNFVNQEAFGLPCSHFFCMYISPRNRPLKYLQFDTFHPAFLYESIFDFIIFIILSVLFLKAPKLKNGIIFSLYLILYSFGRIFIEFIRIDATSFVGSIPFPVIFSVFVIFMGIILIYFIHKN